MAKWSSDQKLSNGNNGVHKAYLGVSLAAYQDKLFCVHPPEKLNLSFDLYYSTLKNQEWSEDKRLSDGTNGEHKSGIFPGLAVYQNKLYCVHRDSLSLDQELWYCSFDGEKWSTEKKLSDGSNGEHTSVEGAAIAEYNGLLYCVHVGKNLNTNLYYCTFDGEKWSKEQPLSNGSNGEHSSYSAPSLAVYNNVLYCVHRGSNYNKEMYYCTFDGTTWSKDTPLSSNTNGEHSTDVSPALAVYNQLLYCVHRGLDGGNLWYSTFDGKEWSKDIQLSDGSNGVHSSAQAPGLAVYNQALYCVHNGSSSQDLWYCSFS